MKNTKLRLTAALLTVLTAAGVLASCGNEAADPAETGAQTTEPVTEAVTEDPLKPENIEGVDLNGYNFRMYTRGKGATMFVEESTGSTMNDAVYERNLAVSEKLNVTFERFYTEGDSNAGNAKNVILANEDAYDIVLPHARIAFSSYIMEGLCYDWYDLTNVDLNKPYWYADARDSFTINDHLFGMVGDIDYDNLGQTKCLYFNKQLVADYDLTSPYELVKNDKWTLPAFAEMVKNVKSDLNGDSQLDMENDVMAYATSWWSGPINVLYAGNQRIAKINNDGEMYLTLNSERTVQLYNDYFSIFNSDNSYLLLQDDSSPIVKAFKDGRMLIMDGLLYSAESLRTMDLDFGIIPWPKLDETETEYRTGCDAGCNLIIVPVTIPDVDCTSVIMEALCYYGNKIVIPAYYDIALQTKAARDEESAAMLDIIRASRLYDVGYFVGVSAFGNTGYTLSKSADHSFASFYAANEASAQASCDKINKYFAEHE